MPLRVGEKRGQATECQSPFFALLTVSQRKTGTTKWQTADSHFSSVKWVAVPRFPRLSKH
jgi:hypothetical protein